MPTYRGCATSCFYLLKTTSNEYGVTAHLISEQIDEGPILKVRKFSFDREGITGIKLNHLAIRHMLELLKEILERDDLIQLNKKHQQKEMKLSLAGSDPGNYFSKTDLAKEKNISFFDDLDSIEKKIKAFWFPPYHGANIIIGNKTFTLVDHEILEEIGQLYKKFMKER